MKIFYRCLLVLSLTLLFTSMCFADSTYEIEPNNSFYTAQEIRANNHDPAGLVNYDYSSQSFVRGHLNRMESDFFKVHLPANNQTVLAIKSRSYPSFKIYDSNYKLIVSEIAHMEQNGYYDGRPYYVNIPADGDYYVKVFNRLQSGEYSFSIGTPNYTFGDYKYITHERLTVTANQGLAQSTYDFRNLYSVPMGAIVYEVTISGENMGMITDEIRGLKSASQSEWACASSTPWQIKVPVSPKGLLRNVWAFKLEGKVNDMFSEYTLSPTLEFKYVYPILPR